MANSLPTEVAEVDKSDKLANYNCADSDIYTEELGKQPSLPEPTDEEYATLRRVVAPLNWVICLLCLVEFAERASYYGTGDRLYNYYQYPLPAGGNGAGAVASDQQNPGALGKGLRVATSLTLLFKFTSYFFPLITGYITDKYIGKMRMLWFGVWTGIVSHVLFIVAALPSLLKKPDIAMGLSIIALLTLCLCTAFVKPVLLPLMMEQYPYQTNVVKTLETGERVIVDRDASFQRMTMSFYWCINVGGFLSVATSYSALKVGYWLAYLIPLIIYLTMPIILIILQRRLVESPPSGESILGDFIKVLKVCFEGGWYKRYKDGSFWEYARPSNLERQGRIGWRKNKPGFYGEHLVDDIRVTLSACVIFLYYVLFNMNDNQLASVINNQSGSMSGGGVPNDLISNFNQLSIIITMPLLDYVIYPALRRWNVNFKPTHRVFTGFFLAALSCFAGALIQWRVYETSPCGYNASTCSETREEVSPLSRWIVAVEFALEGISECFAMTTGYAIAFDKSPEHMKSFVLALFLFTTAVSSVITQIFSPLMEDPYLIVPFALFASLGIVFSFIFLWRYRNLDKEMELDRKKKLQKAPGSSMDSPRIEIAEVVKEKS